MKQIAVKISDASHARLQHLAHQGKTNYATIVENALALYQPSELTSESTSEIHSGVSALIEAAMQPILDRLEALESMELVKPLNPEQGIVVRVESAHQEAHQGGDDEQTVVEAVADKIASDAPGAAVDAIEREASLATPTADYPDVSESKPVAEESFSSILPDESSSQGKPTVKEFIAELIANGERSQQTISDALYKAGYRTKNGTKIERSSPQIKKPLDAAKALDREKGK